MRLLCPECWSPVCANFGRQQSNALKLKSASTNTSDTSNISDKAQFWESTPKISNQSLHRHHSQGHRVLQIPPRPLQKQRPMKWNDKLQLIKIGKKIHHWTSSTLSLCLLVRPWGASKCWHCHDQWIFEKLFPHETWKNLWQKQCQTIPLSNETLTVKAQNRNASVKADKAFSMS